MSVIYAVLCHRSPGHVADLVRRLHHPGHHLILHADAKGPASMHALLAQLAGAFPDVHVLDSAACAWGGWSLVEAALRAVSLALALPCPWRHFVLLSEHHMPLQPPATIAASLPDGASFIEAAPLTGMDRATRGDILHRFARRYRELPGVGMFAEGARTLDASRHDALRFGSQWIVLARAACERLAALRDDEALWEPFRTSLVPDETALQSVLRGTPAGQGLDIRNAGLSFTAWPHLGGGADSSFTDSTVREARARGFLFIRKRPQRLPPFAASVLAAMPQRPFMPPVPEVPEQLPSAAGALGAEIGRMLRGRFPEIAVRAGPDGGAPACFLQFEHGGAQPSLVVCLVSQDMRTFKVLLAWRRAFDGGLNPIRLAGNATTVMGVRLPGLLLAREVHLPDMPNHGFVTVADGDLRELASALAVALAAARRLSPLTQAA